MIDPFHARPDEKKPGLSAGFSMKERLFAITRASFLKAPQCIPPQASFGIVRQEKLR